MLDSSATASAAPEMAIRGLVSSTSSGSGRRGRKLNCVSATGCAFGIPVTFPLYLLPNPPTAITDRASVPPLLVGTDFIHEVGLLVDFRMGSAMNTLVKNAGAITCKIFANT